MTKTWKVIPSFPEYEASDAGEIRRAGHKGARPLSLFRERHGHLKATLWLDGRTKSQWAHRLVCEAFHGPAPDAAHAAHAAHENGIPDDNRPENLSWKTAAENASDKRRHGTENIGARNGMAVLDDAQIVEIRRRIVALPRSSGGKRIRKGALGALAAEYGVTDAALRFIITGRTWSHVQ